MTDSLPLHLASGSPRRRHLLASAGIAFALCVVPVDEEALAARYVGPLDRLGEYLAQCKARAALDALRDAGTPGRVLAADTTVLLDGVSLVKPRDAAEARGMLDTLRGREHVVATGVALGSTASEVLVAATSLTRVLMRAYGEDEVAAYVASGDPYDKAGGYSIQHATFEPVARFTGCHLGVIGLPLCLVAALLAVTGGSVPATARSAARSAACGAASGACGWSPRCTPPFPSADAMRQGRARGALP